MTNLAKSLPGERSESRLPDLKPVYTPAEAKAEADRCLYCADAPCIQACPTSIDIPTFIKKIASENVRGSARTILEQNILGYSCARVCPVEVLCVGACVYNGWHRAPIAIGRLQRFATETATRAGEKPLFVALAKTGKDGTSGGSAHGVVTRDGTSGGSARGVVTRQVALIGAGPASLACAAELALGGHHATIFEKRAVPGGLNTTGIAPYKLHAEDALHEVEWVASLGVEIRTGVEVGKDLKGPALLAEYDAVFIGVGLGADSKLGLPGEDGPGVFGATAWIEAMKLTKAEKDGTSAGSAPGVVTRDGLGRVVVVGGGNTAIDMARECAQLGAKSVTMVYRRGPSEMSGYAHELESARKEGVELLFETTPVGFERDASQRLMGVRVASTQGGKPVAGTERILPCETVGVAIGQSKLRGIALELAGVALDAKGCVVADPATGATGNKKVWSGGDCINGGKEVVNAVADGRNAARDMMRGWGGGEAKS
jgi:dihydropyrimidine dehydrogenase (NAD+) subunit PreT